MGNPVNEFRQPVLNRSALIYPLRAEKADRVDVVKNDIVKPCCHALSSVFYKIISLYL